MNYKVSIIGSGNVATHLGKAMFNAGIIIREIYSRNHENAKFLANILNTVAVNSIDLMDENIDLLIISINDEAFELLANDIKKLKVLTVHTSGTLSINAFVNFHENYGVFYPLQTFSKEKDINFENIPICIEANKVNDLTKLENIGKMISSSVKKLSSNERKKLHIAAVFACNFTNHLYTLAEKFLNIEGIDFNILKPLIDETSSKIVNHSPKNVQTGPAIRKDQITIEEHLQLLDENKDPRFSEIYKILTNSIQQEHNIYTDNKKK